VEQPISSLLVGGFWERNGSNLKTLEKNSRKIYKISIGVKKLEKTNWTQYLKKWFSIAS